MRSPSDPGYVPTAPPALTQGTALALLTQAGYQVDENASTSPTPAPPSAGSRTSEPPTLSPESTHGRISKDGVPLPLVIGVAANDPTSVAVANTAADQLRNVGIAASVQPLDPVVLYGDAVPNNRVDAVVGWHAGAVTWPPSWRRATAAGRSVSYFGAERDDVRCTPSSTTPFPSSAPTPVTPASGPAPEPVEPVEVPNNITGLCDSALQPRIDAALEGDVPIGEVIDYVEPKLWATSTVLPILQDTTIVAAGPRVENVSLTGAVPVGIVADAGRWVKMAQ